MMANKRKFVASSGATIQYVQTVRSSLVMKLVPSTSTSRVEWIIQTVTTDHEQKRMGQNMELDGTLLHKFMFLDKGDECGDVKKISKIMNQ